MADPVRCFLDDRPAGGDMECVPAHHLSLVSNSRVSGLDTEGPLSLARPLVCRHCPGFAAVAAGTLVAADCQVDLGEGKLIHPLLFL